VKTSPWPWAIGLIMVSVLAGVIAFSARSIRSGVDLVAPDYYAQEIRHQARIEATRRALALGTNAVVAWQAGELNVSIAGAAGATGTVTFYRPAASALDRELPLTLDGDGRQTSQAPLAPGLWRIRTAWSQAGQDYYLERAIVVP